MRCRRYLSGRYAGGTRTGRRRRLDSARRAITAKDPCAAPGRGSPRGQRVRWPQAGGNAGTGNGNRYLARVVGEAAVSAGRIDTFLGERYRRIARRHGKKRAIVAVGRSILVIVWALFSGDDVEFVDLDPNHYDSRINPQRKVSQHVRELQALGYSVTFKPAV